MPINYNFEKNDGSHELESRQKIDDEIREFVGIEPDTEHWSWEFEAIVMYVGVRCSAKFSYEHFTELMIRDVLTEEINATLDRPEDSKRWAALIPVAIEFAVKRYTLHLWRGG